MTYQLRWMINVDYPGAFRIEAASYPNREDRLLANLRDNKDLVRFVAEENDQVLAFLVYAIYPSKYEIRSLVVDPKYRRSGIGTSLHKKLESRLSTNARSCIVAPVREENLEGQLFFKSLGYRAVHIKRQTPPLHDEYIMQFVNKSCSLSR